MQSLIIALLFIIGLTGCARGSDEQPQPVTMLDRSALDSLSVPDWVYGTWYEIVPDRLWNGDPTNDPTVESLVGATRGYSPELLTSANWTIRAWGSPWYGVTPWERAVNQDFYEVVELRRYGGDIAGIVHRLPYLDSLGVRVLNFSGVADGPSILKFDAENWHHVDRHLGPDPQADAEQMAGEDFGDPESWGTTQADRAWHRLLETVHQKGYSVVIDVRLADLLEDTSGDGRPAELTHAVLHRWLDPDGNGDFSDGVDGFRLVDAGTHDPELVADIRLAVKSVNTQAVLVGDVNWSEGNTLAPLDAYLNGPLDAVTNHYLFREARALLAHPSEYGSLEAFVQTVDSVFAARTTAQQAALLSVIGTHNTPRAVTSLQNYRIPYYTDTSPREYDRYLIFKPNQAAQFALRNTLVLQFTLPGVPILFYGEEAGMWGANYPDNVKPMVWPDVQYDEEVFHPRNRLRPPDPVAVNDGQLDFFRRVVRFRNAYNDVLTHGSINWMIADNDRPVLAYERVLGQRRVVVAMSIAHDETSVTFEELGLPPDAETSVQGVAIVEDGRIDFGAKGVVVFAEG
ncbi:MAG: alpha-amylase family glycosyl hydrolase [Rubricoccaceae bacterium]|nr:alpha-amylase family glycosyl hydrolase [Rubricoccaceae bacterium]